MARELKAAEGLERPRRHTQVEVEQSLEQLSYWLDGVFRIPGTGWRFGLDAVAGLVPGVGDFATSAVSFYILAAGVRYGVPKATLLRMGANLGIDYLLGSIPLVGDLFDAYWKSNQKNVELLKRRATVSAEEARRGRVSDWLFVGSVILVLVAILVGSVLLALYLLSLIFRNIPSPF
jgi:Domain of unknown function (DUF4112)